MKNVKALVYGMLFALMMGPLATAHAGLQPMDQAEMRAVAGQGLNLPVSVTVTLQNPVAFFEILPPVVPIRDLLPSINADFQLPIVITRNNPA